MGAPRPGGPKVVSVYVPPDGLDVWEWLRRYAFDNGTSASAIVFARIEELQAATERQQASTLKRAQEISAGRRKRADG